MPSRLLVFTFCLILCYSPAIAQKTNKSISQNLSHIDTTLTTIINLFRQGEVEQPKKMFAIIPSIDSIEVKNIDNRFLGDWYYVTGIVHRVNGKYSKALTSWKKSVQYREKILDEYSIDLADNYYQLGGIYSIFEDFDKAILFHEKCLKISLKKDYALDKIYGALGIVNLEIGNYKKTEEYFKKGLEHSFLLDRKDYASIAHAYSNLGHYYKVIGQTDEALKYYQSSLEFQKEVDNGSTTSLAHLYAWIGEVYLMKNKLEDSERNIESSLKILEQTNNDFIKGTALYFLGNVLIERRKNKESIPIFEESLGLHINSLGEQNSETSKVYHRLGDVYIQLGDLEKGLKNYDRALSINSKLIKNHPKNAEIYISLSKYYSQEEDFDKAINFSKLAQNEVSVWVFENIEITSLPVYLKSLSIESEIRLQWYLSSGDKEQLRHAIQIFDLAYRKIIENLNWLENIDALPYLDLFENGIRAAIMDDQADSKFDRVFKYFETSKNLSLLKGLNESDALEYGQIPKSVLSKERDLRNQIFNLEKKKIDLIVKQKNNDSLMMSFTKKLVELNFNYEKLKSNLESNYPEYYELKYDLEPFTINEIQNKLLNSNQTILEYFIGKNSIYAFVINKNNYKFYEIQKDFPLEEWVKRIRFINQKDNFAGLNHEYMILTHDLFRKIVSPMWPELKEEIVIIPDGVLGYIPFETLLVKPVKQSNRCKSHHYLLRDKTISYCYSTTLLNQMQEKEHLSKANKSLLAFAPFYDGSSYTVTDGVRTVETLIDPLDPLPNTGEEVLGIHKLFGGDVFLHQNATERNFLNKAADYRILHLATHGKANDYNGDHSFLAFTQKKDNVENELLYVKDLYSLRLNADMVVLSACETGIGELKRGEGIISLSRGFTYAGSKCIVTTLWSVSDKSTKDLIISFYKNLKKGMKKNVALRKAKIDFIDNPEKKHSSVHPFYWSGFIGIGDMEPLW